MRSKKKIDSDFKEKLNLLFRMLRVDGFWAEQNWRDCSSCGWAGVPEGKTDVVFYHEQDAEDLPEGYVYLAWSGDHADRIIKRAVDAGLQVEWNRTKGERIKVGVWETKQDESILAALAMCYNRLSWRCEMGKSAPDRATNEDKAALRAAMHIFDKFPVASVEGYALIEDDDGDDDEAE